MRAKSARTVLSVRPKVSIPVGAFVASASPLFVPSIDCVRALYTAHLSSSHLAGSRVVARRAETGHESGVVVECDHVPRCELDHWFDRRFDSS